MLHDKYVCICDKLGPVMHGPQGRSPSYLDRSFKVLNTRNKKFSIRNCAMGLEELKPNQLRLGRIYSNVQSLKPVSTVQA